MRPSKLERRSLRKASFSVNGGIGGQAARLMGFCETFKQKVKVNKKKFELNYKRGSPEEKAKVGSETEGQVKLPKNKVCL